VSGSVHEFPNTQLAIRTLHAEIERLASAAAASYIPCAPIGVTNNGIGDEMTMFYDANHVKVFTCDGTVFMSGIEHGGYWPDWFCLSNQEARLIAQALMSAAAFVAPVGSVVDGENQ
jgi:dihydroorotase-like cyclic amidohydrolase